MEGRKEYSGNEAADWSERGQKVTEEDCETA